MKVAVPLAENILAPLGITATASAIDTGIQNRRHGSGTTTLIISKEEMNFNCSGSWRFQYFVERSY